jgi:hypothetical protein
VYRNISTERKTSIQWQVNIRIANTFTDMFFSFHCRSRNYATPRLNAEVAFVRPEKEEQSDWLVWPNDSFYWPRMFILQTDTKSIQCFQKHAKLIDSIDQKLNWLECGNFSQDAGTPGTQRVIVFSQLAVKGLNCSLTDFFIDNTDSKRNFTPLTVCLSSVCDNIIHLMQWSFCQDNPGCQLTSYRKRTGL